MPGIPVSAPGHQTLRDPEVTVSSVAKRYGVSRVMLYAHLNALEKERA